MENKKSLSKNSYQQLIGQIRAIVSQARNQASRQINQLLVKTYWEIGKEIVEYEQKGQERAEYGSEVLKNLSKELTDQFGKGFTKTNLYNMALFYKSYKIFQTLSGKLSWSHY